MVKTTGLMLCQSPSSCWNSSEHSGNNYGASVDGVVCGTSNLACFKASCSQWCDEMALIRFGFNCPLKRKHHCKAIQSFSKWSQLMSKHFSSFGSRTAKISDFHCTIIVKILILTCCNCKVYLSPIRSLVLCFKHLARICAVHAPSCVLE